MTRVRSSSPVPGGHRRARPVLLAVAVVALLGATGCGAGNPLDPPAAIVGDTTISDDVLEADIEAENSALPADAAGAPAIDIRGAGEGTYDGDIVTAKLADRVRYELLGRLIRREGIAVTEEQRAQARERLCGGDPQSGQPADCTAFESYPDDYQEFQETLVTRELAVAETLATGVEAGLRAEYDALVEAGDESLRVSCFDFAAFQTEEDALAAAERAAQGVDLSELSEQYQPPQCLPFASRGELPPELANIPDQSVSDPLTDEASGLIVLARRQDQAQSFEDFARARGPQNIEELIDSILQDELGDVSVEVNPRYGRWDEEQFRVVGNELPAGFEQTVDEAEAGAEQAQTDPAGQ